ncbi:SDR family oxidoreductase [Microvirga roseola]|uniref:SDR family oxidoreductase n=1 Tax=Microvirga roseola TaxID=2883126 RepID=UPI001E38059B|nr:SDR family oxidoreductase [Microvirga roseola]
MRLFAFGIGYSAQALIETHRSQWSRIAGTVRRRDKAEHLRRDGIAAFVLDDRADERALFEEIRRADAILISAPPTAEGDPVLTRFGDSISSAAHCAWIGYLSTTGVYGDHGGAWVDEQTPPHPQSRSSVQRLAAEQAWLALGGMTESPVHIFRLTGIYGPGRNVLIQLAQGTARRIQNPGQVFNRIHVEDIAATLAASLQRPRAGAIYNVTDDEPAPQQDVVAYAARLAGVEPPPEIAFEVADLSPMARTFYGENKRVSNRLIRSELDVGLRYPTYREGLRALHEAGEFAQAA